MPMYDASALVALTLNSHYTIPFQHEADLGLKHSFFTKHRDTLGYRPESRMNTIPSTMKACVATKPGHPRNVLELRPDYPVPSPPKAGEVMIKLSHVTLNNGDLKMMQMPIPFRRNFISGFDYVGEVVQIGSPPDTKLKVGMCVAGAVPADMSFKGFGSLAEYVVVPADGAVEKPSTLGRPEAAGLLGIAGQTAVCMVGVTELSPGDRALINGASGGVGIVLTQVLTAMGIHVTGVCSGKNEEFVRRLGAREVRTCRLLSLHTVTLRADREARS
jgi:NADPH:quinone reductase-like Zn-dependent oxidoreductase